MISAVIAAGNKASLASVINLFVEDIAVFFKPLQFLHGVDIGRVLHNGWVSL